MTKMEGTLDKQRLDEGHTIVFLRRMVAAADRLSQTGVYSSKKDTETPDVSVLVEELARYLLKACKPEVLASDVSDFPTLPAYSSTELLLEDEEGGDNVEFYKARRTDYLRQLLRILAPISMHVMGTSFSMVMSSQDLQLPSFLLLSHWLPVAPHLAPMVVDFLKNSKNPFEISDLSQQEHAFLFAEACHNICLFFGHRGEIDSIRYLWDWAFLFGFMQSTDTEMMDSTDSGSVVAEFLPTALRWYSVRALTILLDWRPQVVSHMLEQIGLADDRVAWVPHPWTVDREEASIQASHFRGAVELWGSEQFQWPSAVELLDILPESPYIGRVGSGISFYKDASMLTATDSMGDNDSMGGGTLPKLISTTTTRRNLTMIGTALCQEPCSAPILLCGPHGSGKSSIVREMLRLCRPSDSLLEFHIDEETDSKTLVGSYTTTDIPGEFAWRPGPLTHAIREGRWVLFEDMDSVPVEIQATLVKLLQDRVLPLGNGNQERCHPNFRIFGTCTTSPSLHQKRHSLRMGANRGAGRQILNPSLWRSVHVEPLPYSELQEVVDSLYPHLPNSVCESALSLLHTMDRSGRAHVADHIVKEESEGDDRADTPKPQPLLTWSGGRTPSVRDLFKLLSRISNGICFEQDTAYATEAQRLLCLVESVDVFAGSCPEKQVKRDFVQLVAAPVWGISKDLAVSHIEQRRPSTLTGAEHVEIGRAKIQIGRRNDYTRKTSGTFAATNHALRFMEAVSVCVRENEPCLLVGETGCGKTTLIQHIASNCERELVVQNLSLQTDSTDLLGGYKPLELGNAARKTYEDFVDLFVSTFSRKQNAKFLQYAAQMLEKSNWKKLSQCFQRAAQLGNAKVRERNTGGKVQTPSSRSATNVEAWNQFTKAATTFERQRVSCDAGLAFDFAEGALVEAIRTGKWVLLDEINLASSDTLQRLCGLLDEPTGSITLTERGDDSAIKRHPNFRLFAAMNPATDAGKKDLPASIRSRFSELYVDELLDPVELRVVAANYLSGVLPTDGKPNEHKDIVVGAIEVYLKCRRLAENDLADGNGHKPRYTLRTLTRALSAANMMVLQQRIPLQRAIYEGFQLSFEGALDDASAKLLKKALSILLPDGTKKRDLDHPGRRPGGKNESDYALVKPFWVKTGPLDPVDWSEVTSTGKSRFILTPSISHSLRRLSRTLAAGPWPVLLEGPTSAGKTTLVEYIAARCGHHVVRINNHEHTDVQEYTGSFAADQNGSLSFRDGLLVRALRRGHWVILDELNLAPTEVLEALNRLLDDNRELYLAETNETVRPHPNFRLFATQNPSGAYGGRKPLSRAFRNRFVEIHMGDIPSTEMVTILEKRCACPLSHAKRLVDVMVSLRHTRSKNNVFLGKDSFITPRDLLRWAERKATSKLELAEQGYMLLAERLRSDEEKEVVKEVLEEHLKVSLDMNMFYYGPRSKASQLMEEISRKQQGSEDKFFASVAPTTSLLRLICLVMTCIEQGEPVLLVGETGCGKTTVVQFLSVFFNKLLYSVNCHATTETSDLIGGLRPVRGRGMIQAQIFEKLKDLVRHLPHKEILEGLNGPGGLDLKDISQEGNAFGPGTPIPYEVDDMVKLSRKILDSIGSDSRGMPDDATSRNAKRRRLTESGDGVESESSEGNDDFTVVQKLASDIEDLGRRHGALFEWSDGPLVQAMKSGEMLLLDEMSLAEDAVLERLNSVLEPSRTLVLAEKGDDGGETESRVVVANDGFRIFATMNPGGDFGKRELSPALRSRFTEIWVPPVTARTDFELVLGRTLSSSADLASATAAGPILERMLTYVDWFNKTICADSSSSYTGYALSLRDILSWAQFVVEARAANDGISLWDAFFHGACLMHLDGLGLGSGLALEDASSMKKKAVRFLLDDLPLGCSVSNVSGANSRFEVQSGGLFGSFPFFTTVGPQPAIASSFDMAAPTTSLNTFRVLRAMQLRKPILLEGSPGVGKTSLITALASAAGHKLVRINLSEQTDIADLMGSDLPVQSSASTGAAFEWCDGILLTAIKEGSWVLLDELNLASQSVLEGLNSCLDHRATVYIPELGKTYHCPSSFRVFAAQNPLAQGGGRKGLPKSFLNRFTKVYVDALTESDLRSIVTSQYPAFDRERVDQMVGFNSEVNIDVVEKRIYGAEGSPWEFNLRDVFRWCKLIESGAASLESAARDIYLQRFRTETDRTQVDRCFRKYFGTSLVPLTVPEFRVTESSVQIGDTFVRRQEVPTCRRGIPMRADPDYCISQDNPMEAIARCVSLRWPSLLIGPSASGKTSIVAALAELCNVELVEHYLSTSSDVTELVGCFEQADSQEFALRVASELCDLADDYLFYCALDSSVCKTIWELSTKLKCWVAKMSGSDSGDLNPVRLLGLELCEYLAKESKRELAGVPPSFSRQIGILSESVAKWRQGGGQGVESGHFIWRDGILVEAMTKGQWLLLENVNLCPSSVLDRLNSVMEVDGVLLLSECGMQDDGTGSSHRVIEPHPDFRVFLTMNSTNGEVSRAMRNRCVELYLPNPVLHLEPEEAKPISKIDSSRKVDFLGMMHRSGARSVELASALMFAQKNEHAMSTSAGEETPCLKQASALMAILSGLLSRGAPATTALGDSLQLVYELNDEPMAELAQLSRFNKLALDGMTPLPLDCSIRSVWLKKPQVANLEWESRLLRVFDNGSRRPLELIAALGLLDPNTADDPEIAARYQVLATIESEGEHDLGQKVLQCFLNKMSPEELSLRYTTFRGYPGRIAKMTEWMLSSIQKSLSEFHSDVEDGADIGSAKRRYLSNSVVALSRKRLHRTFAEKEWLQTLLNKADTTDSVDDLTALEASVLLAESALDPASVPCPVTPVLYPFFCAVEDFLQSLFSDNRSLVQQDLSGFANALASFFDELDVLWDLLKDSRMDCNARSLLGFDEGEFIVQWKWLKKKMPQMEISARGISSSLVSTKARAVESLVATIDAALFGEKQEWSAHAIRKRQIRPAVPHFTQHWEGILDLRQLADQCTLLADPRFAPFNDSDEYITLGELIQENHPLLFLKTGFKSQIVAALSTLHWCWTDEEIGHPNKQPDAQLGRLSFHDKLNVLLVSERGKFSSDLTSARVDLTISTVDNQLDADKLGDLVENSDVSLSNSEAYSRITHTLLSAFANVQMSPLAEYWCSHEEKRLIGELCSILLAGINGDKVLARLRELLPAIRHFVNNTLSRTIWPVYDLRAFQTLLWAVEGWQDGQDGIRTLLRSLLSPMLLTAAKHAWLNTFNNDVISPYLDMPNMWADEEGSSSRKTQLLGKSLLSSEPSYGSARQYQKVRTEAVLKLAGHHTVILDPNRGPQLHTIENHSHRVIQNRGIAKLIASFPERKTKATFQIIQYVFADLLEAARDGLDCAELSPLLSAVRNTEELRVWDVRHFEECPNCSDGFVRQFLEKLILPLVEFLKEAWLAGETTLKYSESVAKASVYLGLLRLNVSAPDSPLDPGKSPQAKVHLMNRKLRGYHSEVTAVRLENGFCRGEFNPRDSEVLSLLDHSQAILQEQQSQQKKIVERLGTAPPFSELYREIRNFIGMVSPVEVVLELAEALSRPSVKPILLERAANWQRTAEAFCQRLSDQFQSYEDVTSNVVGSVRMIQDGLHLLSKSKSSTTTGEQSHLLSRFLQCPMVEHTDTIMSASLSLEWSNDQPGVGTNGRADYTFAIAAATLTRLLLKKQLIGLAKEDVRCCSQVLDYLAGGHMSTEKSQDKDETVEAALERTYREQFPDHSKEFLVCFDENDGTEEIQLPEADDESAAAAANVVLLSDAQVEFLCNVHQSLCRDDQVLSDPTRVLAFRCAYNAAYEINNTYGLTRQVSLEEEPMGANIFAMALSTNSGDTSSAALLSPLPNMVDFQNDPNPSEVLAAAAPLERLMARVTQLLTAFSGHSILLGIGRVCDRVRKFDLATTPHGKVMAGLEVILRQAQDWEQHASERVRLGRPLEDLGRLVAKWRKLELESWPKLVSTRRSRHAKRAQHLWIRLLGVIRVGPSSTSDALLENSPTVSDWSTECADLTPKWVWKGVSRSFEGFAEPLDCVHLDELVEIVKALDTFILTSPLGEFEERMRLLESCALQLKDECRSSEEPTKWQLLQSRTVESLWAYYAQFAPKMSTKLEAILAPVAVKLKEEMKLAKWDEQTYYALAESTEKNHRKLMRLLSQVDEGLGVNVGELVQEETRRGIRSSDSGQEEPCTTVPPETTFFPFSSLDQKEVQFQVRPSPTPLPNPAKHDWTDPFGELPEESHLRKLPKYAKKMNLIGAAELSRESTWARIGTDSSSSLCEAIFDRIATLRNKSTRQMKERALTDLLRELKLNGFTTTKFSLPDELRHLENLFLLPRLSVDTSALSKPCLDVLDKSEKYYQRCLVELSALRSETTLLGSKHVTKREMETMVALAENGLAMLTQQRCLLVHALSQGRLLKECASRLAIGKGGLPVPQGPLRTKVRDFETAYCLAADAQKQLSLVLRSSNTILEGATTQEWARDCASKLLSMADRMTNISDNHQDEYVVTWDRLHQIEKKSEILQESERITTACREECRALGGLPIDLFDSTLRSIVGALNAAGKCQPSTPNKPEPRNVQPTHSMSHAVERLLIAFQNIPKQAPLEEEEREGEPEAVDTPLWKCHTNVLRVWSAINLKNVGKSLSEALQDVMLLLDTTSTHDTHKNGLVDLLSDISFLSRSLQTVCERLMEDTALFHRHSAKLLYVILRVFRVLVAKGFCSDETREDDEGEGDVGDMKFEDDQDGTGMGEGDGKNDVTDQLENEEQLLGLKSDKDTDDDPAQKQESRQLNEEEADQGMEMENDFDGEMCDIPDKPDEQDTEEQEGEELDREMGDEPNPDESVVDERMWNDSDDEEEHTKDEKFEKDSEMKGEALDGATHTKEEDDGNGNDRQDDTGKDENRETADDNAGETQGEDDDNDEINEQQPDQYEEGHGIEAKDDSGSVEAPNDDDDNMSIDDELDLDGDNGEENNGAEGAETEQAVLEELEEPQSEEAGDDNKESMDVEPEEQDDNVEEIEPTPAAAGTVDPNQDDMEQEQDDQEDELDNNDAKNSTHQAAEQQAHGVRSKDGADAVMEEGEEEGDEGGMEEEQEATGDGTGSGQAAQVQNDSGGGSGNAENDQTMDNSMEAQQEEQSSEIPNPFKDPGDASKFWHRKLNMVDSNPDSEEPSDPTDGDIDDSKEEKGEFEYTSQEQSGSNQVLGEATHEQAEELDIPPQTAADEEESPEDDGKVKQAETRKPEQKLKKKQNAGSSRTPDVPEPGLGDDDQTSEQEDEPMDMEKTDGGDESAEEAEVDDSEGDDDNARRNQVVSDLSRLNVESSDPMRVESQIVQADEVSGRTATEMAEAHARWQQIQGDTHHLSRRLCEKLRLVMEPLVASKLRGDYRSGKRINMKRVISYIASGYRKDKIWLRRTKPAKRDYRVLLAVDDSESMKTSGAGDMALRALSTLAVGMNQLEIGELGIASFGEDMKLLHPFHLPFTSESGAGIAMNFQFDQKRTRTSLCVESALSALDTAGGSSSMQLVFLISDGRIERDSRATLKRLIREMMERNVLLAMIIVEGQHKKKDSIVNMKEVTFEKGKPVVRRFIEDYPIPYYIVLDDMKALPEVLGDALRQWFEMLAQLQSPR